ncbi:MAG TPA: protocatechuate 3,4-dioxygenase subunit beta [Candidatus Binataceae bacterium]|nr:protocatechuate 3,4-dioxygenase subunit beta [Candidatus Binataceae bacterium]
MTAGYRRPAAGTHPPNDSPAYASTAMRAPRRPAVRIEASLSEITGPRFDSGALEDISPARGADLSRFAGGAALGERIIVTGRVLDAAGRAVPGALLELWQANAAGRYAHPNDLHDAPLDPHFSGAARLLTGADGGYRFVTIKPGAYPWRNHPNAWRPQHIHFSVFGSGFAARLVTQMYFPGDPLLAFDPIFLSVADPSARARLVAEFDLGATIAEYALGYRFDIILRGRGATPALG